jgi:dTDP-glucose 4,6-dehydratase
MKKTVIVTGGLGFIGSHYVDLLLSRGYKVINIDKITYASNLDFCPAGDYTFIKADVKDLDHIPYCDYIVHFAAESHVDSSILNNEPFIHSNILGTHRILELLKNQKRDNFQLGWEYKEPVLIYIGTDEVFGEIIGSSFFENDPHNPGNPYSASKSCAEQLVKAWGRTYHLPYRITRTTNNYGPRQHPEKLIPRCITNCLKGEKIPIQGTGEYIRNWIYVKDNCEAIFKVMANGANGETYHISSSEEYSVVQIVKMILGKFGLDFDKNVEFVSNRSGQDYRYALNCDKIHEQLGWVQEHKFNDVLDEIIKGYKDGIII